MNKALKQSLLMMAASLCILPASAQLSTNPDKFLGNITTGNSEMDHDGFRFSDYWNQVTPENATKWQSVEGTRGVYNWGGADNAANYAKQHNFPFKFHTFIWGSQYPSWIKDLSLNERYDAIAKWMDAAKEHYPYLQVMDVANECMQGHQDDTYLFKDALGGGGKTGYDWLIKAFEMAGERWPDAILVYNDFNVLRWDNNNLYIPLVQTLRDAGAPIDAYGCQAHHFTLNDIPKDELENRLNTLQTSLKMPMYITEYDISFDDDTKQAAKYKEQIPLFWEADYCAGITLWGWFLGATWAENTGLIRNRQERAALQWLREYMQTDAAKNAKSPFPGTKKEASIYIRPASLKVAAGDVLPIKIHARLATKTIQKVDLYVNDELVKTMTEVPYIVEHTAKKASWNTMKAVVTATDGTTYERYGGFTVAKGTKRSPYNGTPTEIPGIVKANEYDKGLVDVTYSSGASRSNPMSVSNGQWMDYTVDVKEEGLYTMDLEVASAIAGGRFHLAEYSFDNIEFLTDFTDVPNTGSTTEFQPVHCSIKKYLTAGKHVFTLLVEKGGFYIKDMTFKLLPTFAMPGTVEAEDFVTNKGGSVVTINGGFAWGNAANGDYAEYSVKVNQAGKYAYEATVASEVSGSKFTMKLIDSEGNETSMPLVKVPNKGKDTYEVKTGNVKTAFKEGLHTLRINVTGGTCNIDKIKFTCTEPASGIDEIMSDDASNAPAYNLMGVPVNAGYRGIVIKNGKKMFVK
jgi:GH35 family endo-1,4-beta-xylanase